MSPALLELPQADPDLDSANPCFGCMGRERQQDINCVDAETGHYLDWDLVDAERPRLFPY